MLDIVRDIRAAFCDHDPEDAGGNGHTFEALEKFGIGRNESLDRDDVHVDVILVDEIDKPISDCVSARQNVKARS
jgi:hypothetical protein